MKKQGFTLLELGIAIAFVGILLIVGFTQQANLDVMQRDDARKIAINAMYYGLEEGFYATNGYYPESISEANLKTVDPALFSDPDGIVLGQEGCNYSYKPANCDAEGRCQEYILRSLMEKEDVYIKKSRSH